MIQKKIKLSDFPLLNKLLLNGKTILAYDKKNYYTELKNIKGDNIVDIEEISANSNEGKRENLIKLKFDTDKVRYLSVYNGEDGEKGDKGDQGEQGLKGSSFSQREGQQYLIIANDDETNDPTKVWSALRGKVMEDFLRSISEKIITDEEYQLLFNEEYDEYGRPNDIHQVFIDMEFVTNSNNKSSAIVHYDNKTYKTYVKYWTYEDDESISYYIKLDDDTYQEVPGFDIWEDYYLNPNNTNTYYTRKLVVTEFNEVTQEVISSEYQYTEIVKPIWIDLEFTTTQEDQNSILLHNTYGDDDPADISKEDKESEIIVLHRPITSISIDGDDHITIPINSIYVKAINILPVDYLNSPICIEYDETKIEVFEDGRIMALGQNTVDDEGNPTETIIKIYSEESINSETGEPTIFAYLYVKVITYVTGIQFNTNMIKAFKSKNENDTYQIECTIMPSTASNKSITWTSDDPTIAKVDENGKVLLVGEGTTIITATANDGSDISSSISIMVDTPISGIVLDGISETTHDETEEMEYKEYDLNVLINKPTTIHASILPENASNKSLIWESLSEGVIVNTASNNIDGQVLVNGKYDGRIHIYAADGSDAHAYLNIFAKNPVENMKIYMNGKAAENIVIDKGDTITLYIDEMSALIKGSNMEPDNKNVIWSTDNNDIITINPIDGQRCEITGIAGGIVNVIATAADGSGVTATCQVESVQLIENIYFIKHNMELHVGSTYQLEFNDDYVIYPISNKYVWYTSDETIATVTNSGQITPLKSGNIKVYIAATDNSGIIASMNVKVTMPSERLLLSDDELTMNVNDSYTLIATVEPDDTSYQRVEFTSTDPNIVQVDNNGHIIALSSGTASIFVKTIDTNISSKCDITVL